MRLTSVSTAAVTVTGLTGPTGAADGAYGAEVAEAPQEAPTPRRRRVLLHHAAYF